MKKTLSILLLFCSFTLVFAQTSSIISVNSMANVRSAHAAVTLNNGKLLVMGGRAGSTGFISLSTCEIYNPSTGFWSTTSSMSARRSHPAAVVLNNGKVLIAGGLDYTGSTSYLNSCEFYDPTSNTWSTAPSMNTSREKFQMVLLPDGKVLACGGAGLTNSSEIYDPNTNTWTLSSPMIAQRSEFTLTKLDNGNFIAIGGENSFLNTTAEIFDVQTNSWTLVNATAVNNRDVHGAAILPNGNVLLAGGLSSQSTAEIFNTTTNSFTPTASMTEGRIGCDLLALDNGNIVGIGLGDIFSVNTNILEEYNSTSNTWSSVTTTMTGVQYYRMNKMHDGSILVSGGSFGGSSTNFLRKITVSETGTCNINVNTACTVQTPTFCWGQDADITISSSQSGISYQAFIGTNAVSTILTGNGSNLNLSISGDHFSIGQNIIKIKASKSGCNSKFLNATLSVQTTLSNSDSPLIGYTGDSINCFNNNATLLSATTSNNIVWNNNQTTPNITVNNAGSFSYHTVDPNGCKSMESDPYELYYFPSNLNVDAGSDFTACIYDDSIPLAGSPIGGIWSGTGISNNPSYFDATTLTQGQSYELYYERCNVKDTVEVSIDTVASFTYSTNITYSVNPNNSDTFGICSYGSRTISVSASTVGIYKRIYLEGNSVAGGSGNVVSFSCPMDSNMVGYAEYVLGCTIIRDTFYIEDRIVDNTPAVYYADTICHQDPAIVTILNSNPNTIYQLYEFGNVYSGYVQGNGDTITITATGAGPTNYMIIKGNDLSLSCTQNLSYNFSIYSKTAEARISAHSTTDYTSLDTIPLNVDVSNAIGDTFIWALNGTIIDTGLTSSFTSNVQGLNEVALYAISSPGCYDTTTMSFTIYDLNVSTTPFPDNICSTISLDTLSSLIDGVLSTKVAPNGNYIVGGYKQSWGCLGYGATFATLSILDPQGNLLYHYDHSYHVSNRSNHCGSYISDIEIDHNNDIYISGNIGGKEIINYFGFSYNPPSSNDEDIWGYLAKLDMNGNVLWVKITDGVSTSSTSNTIGTSITDVELYAEDAVYISCYSPKNFSANSSRLDVGNGLISMCEINPANGNVVRKWVAQGDYYVKMFEASRLYSANIYTGRIFIHGPGLINLGCGKIGIEGKFWSTGNNSNLNKLNFDNIQLTPTDATPIVAFADVNQTGELWDSVYTFGSFNANEYGTLANRPQKMKYVDGFYYILNSVSPSYGNTTANVQFDATNQLSGDHFAYLAKYDSLGNFVWHKELRRASYAGFEIVDNEIILIGHTSKFFGTKLSQYSYDGFKTTGRTDWFYAKYDLNGNATSLQQIGGDDVSTSTFYPPLEEFIYQVDYDKCSKKFSILGMLNDQADILGSTFQTSNNNTSEFIGLKLSLDNCAASSCDTTNYYQAVLDISNISDSLRLCNNDTFEFAPISTLANVNYEFTYWDGTSYVPLNNQLFDYNLSGSILEIWNVSSETRIKTIATSTGICNSVLEKITYIYNPFIDITNFPISVNACFDDTVNFNPTFSILNYSSSYTYENNGTFIPLDNQIFDYTVNGSNLTIWNIQSPTTIKIVASSNGPCSYSSSKTSILKSDLYGVIYTSSFVGLPNTTIYAIDLNPIDSSITAIDTVLSGNNGAFILSAFDVDYLKIAPSLATYPNEMPSYYSTTLFIQDATTVSCQTNPHIFRTVAGVNPGGTGFIAGYIGQGAGKANEIGQPISEQFIVIKDSNDDPVQYAITDNNGYFSFSNLAYGEYSFHVDKPFVNNMLAPSVTLTAAESRKDSLLFILHPDHLELLAKPTAINDLIFSNEFVISPNPANAFLNIEITNPTYLGLSKEIKIMDALGKELYFTTSAKNQIKIDLSNENISEGIYLISITLENQTITKKILIN